jgi:hypothetical protein
MKLIITQKPILDRKDVNMMMADVFAIFGTLLAVGIALPGLLLTWRLLLPKVVARAEQRLSHTPWKCFFGGGAFLIIYLIPVIVLLKLPLPVFKGAGVIALLGLTLVASVGAAGLAGLMGQRLNGLGLKSSVGGATVRGAVAMELAAAFPLIGWFIIIPITFIIALGAALFALTGWQPKAVPSTASPGAQQAPASL